MNAVTHLVRERFAAVRARSERGYIMVTAFGIMLLLIGTSLLVLGAAQSNVITAREGREFTEARQSSDDAFASAIERMNRLGDPLRNAVINGTPYPASGSPAPTSRNGRGTWTYTYAPTTRTLTATGTVDDTVQTLTRDVRGLAVGSYDNGSDPAGGSGGVRYGVPANGPGNTGAWRHTLAASVSTESNKTLLVGRARTNQGRVPEVATFGAGQFDTAGLTGGFRAVSYSDGTTLLGTPLSASRSVATASYDKTLLAARMSAATPSACASTPVSGLSTGTYGCSATSTSIGTITNSGTGVKTLVVNGNLTITRDLVFTNTGAAGSSQLHIYVKGSVRISPSVSGAGLTLSGVFIYTANGSCTWNSTGALTLYGSLACARLDLPGTNNSFFPTVPGPDNAALPGAATQSILFAEGDGYIDASSP